MVLILEGGSKEPSLIYFAMGNLFPTSGFGVLNSNTSLDPLHSRVDPCTPEADRFFKMCQ